MRSKLILIFNFALVLNTNIMKILILAAMDKELNLLLNVMPQYNEIKNDSTTFYTGMIGNHLVYVAKCGIGKVNSALNTLRLIKEIKPELIINTGVAGGVDGELKIASVLIPDKVAYHDVWCGPGTEYGAADGYEVYLRPDKHVLDVSKMIFESDNDVKFGLICSGDKFIHTAEEVAEIKSKFPDSKAVDMESASISQTAVSEGIPFAIIRVMSDTPGKGENISQYKNFWGTAPEKTFNCLVKLLNNL